MPSIAFKDLATFEATGSTPFAWKTAIHSGNGGDVIYSLPTARALNVNHIYLNVYRDPNDNLRGLSERLAFQLVPLLLAQPWIRRVSVIECPVALEGIDPGLIDIDYVLDRFRLEDIGSHHLTYAHAKAMGVSIDPNEPYLSLDLHGESEPYVVVALTERYRSVNPIVLRDLLVAFTNIVFLGTPDEWEQSAGLNARVHYCADMYEMAKIILRGALFIGNASLAAAIADGLKVPRLLDVPEFPRNAFPLGMNGYILPSSPVRLRDLLVRVCERSPALRQTCTLMPSYTELVTAAYSEDGMPILPIYLAQSATAGRYDFENRFAPLLIENDDLFLHPGEPLDSRATLRFFDVDLRGRNCFGATIELSHAASQAVTFAVRIELSDGSLLLDEVYTLAAQGTYLWQHRFERRRGLATISLSTALADHNATPEAAWAWFRSPHLRLV